MFTKLMSVSVDYRVPLDKAVITAMRKSKLLEPVWLLRDWTAGRLKSETQEDELSLVNLYLVDLPKDKRLGDLIRLHEMCIYLRRVGIRLATVRELLEIVAKPFPGLDHLTILALGTICTNLSVPAMETDKRGNRLIILRKFSDDLLLYDRILIFEPPKGVVF